MYIRENEISCLLNDDDSSFRETLEIMADELEETYYPLRPQCSHCIYRFSSPELSKVITEAQNNTQKK